MKKENITLFIRLSALILTISVMQLCLGIFIVSKVTWEQSVAQLQKTADRIQEDIHYENGSWDFSKYHADPKIPDTYPLYVLGSDGFVLDRWKPVRGFLDTSDVKKLLQYQTIQSIRVADDKLWRMYSLPIVDHEDLHGVITVGYNESNGMNETAADAQIESTAQRIREKIHILPDRLDTSGIDPRDFPYNISFQVVDAYNRVVTKNNNSNSIDQIPNFMDPSYVGNALQDPRVQQIEDTATKEPFVLVSHPLVFQGAVRGIVVVGKSIGYIHEIIRSFFLMGFLFSCVVSLCIAWGMTELVKRYLLRSSSLSSLDKKVEVTSIKFNKSESAIYVNGEAISIPYATHQYYLCEALFSAPKKRWELDELLERFGEEVRAENWRKVYDTMLLLDKKMQPYIHEKLIVIRDKTYQMNPNLLSKIL